MKPLDSIEIKLCQLQAKIFEESVTKTKYRSDIFIRRFMLSKLASSFDNKSYLFQSISIEESIEMIDSEFGKSSYGKVKYTKDQMFWIGYIYRCIAIKYNLTSKVVYQLFNANEVIKYYNIGHTFDPADMAERMMDSIHYDNSSNYEKSLLLMKKLMYKEKLKGLLGSVVTVYIDRPIGFIHEGTTYTQNYGYIKELIAPDGEFQDAYVIGIDEPIKEYSGKVIGIVERINDNEDKLIVSNGDKIYTKEEIEEYVNFIEKYFKHRIII